MLSQGIHSHIFHCPTEGVCGGVAIERFFAEAEIGQNHVPRAVQHDILWFEVSAERMTIYGSQGGRK